MFKVLHLSQIESFSFLLPGTSLFCYWVCEWKRVKSASVSSAAQSWSKTIDPVVLENKWTLELGKVLSEYKSHCCSYCFQGLDIRQRSCMFPLAQKADLTLHQLLLNTATLRFSNQFSSSNSSWKWLFCFPATSCYCYPKVQIFNEPATCLGSNPGHFAIKLTFSFHINKCNQQQ